jgi:hypothetical protein
VTTWGGAVIFAADLLEANTAFDERRHIGIVCYFKFIKKKNQFLFKFENFFIG